MPYNLPSNKQCFCDAETLIYGLKNVCDITHVYYHHTIHCFFLDIYISCIVLQNVMG